MKKNLLLALGATVVALTANATVRTVSNNVNSPGQYTTLQAAYDASSSNDTLYIHASETSYGNLTMEKPLVLIGEGALPNKQIQYKTQIGGITLTYAPFPATTTASGSKFYGMDIPNLILNNSASTGTGGIGNITVSRCKIGSFNGNATHSNLIIFQNVIGSVNGFKLFNSVFSNNIVEGFNCSSAEGANNLISNNVIQSYLYVKGAVISNNIFYHFASSGSIAFSNNACTFSKNIFYAFTPIVETAVISGSNTGSGNLFNTDPVYTTPATSDQIIAYTYINPETAPFANLHLQASSPGKNYGTDGTDVGIYGGGYPWVDGENTDSRFRYFPMSKQVPHMIEMNVLNPTIPVNGTLNVEFNARSQN
ncbi:MAG: hypothetical protein WCX31_21265 [Salinivirgaceae bacterium]